MAFPLPILIPEEPRRVFDKQLYKQHIPNWRDVYCISGMHLAWTVVTSNACCIRLQFSNVLPRRCVFYYWTLEWDDFFLNRTAGTALNILKNRAFKDEKAESITQPQGVRKGSPVSNAVYTMYTSSPTALNLNVLGRMRKTTRRVGNRASG